MVGLNCLQTFGFGFGNGGSDTSVLPDARLDSFLAAGVDLVRMCVDPAKLCADDSASNTVTTNLDIDIAAVITGINRRTARGLKVIVDMHVIDPGTVSGWGQQDFVDGTAGTKFTRLAFVTTRVAAAIAANTRSSDVALELINEPASKAVYTAGGGAPYQTQIQFLFAAVRAVLPLHTILVMGTQGALDGNMSGDSGDGMINLTPSNFDANTGFSWHPYEPLVPAGGGGSNFFSDAYGLPYPPLVAHWDTTAQAAIAAIIAGGGTDAAKVAACVGTSTTSTVLSNFLTRTNADGGLSATDKLSRITQFVTTNFSFSFPTLYGVSPASNAIQNAAWVASRYEIAGTWADSAGISRRRLFNTEFGTATQGLDSQNGTDDASVVAFIQAHKDAAVASGIGCLTLHEIQGSSYQSTALSSPWGLLANTKAGLRL